MPTYNKLFFALDRSYNQTNSISTQSAIHTFKDLSLTASQITTSGFFPAYFGFLAEEIKAGDILYISGSDGITVFSITDPSAPTLSSAILPNVNWEYSSFPVTFTGPPGWVGGITRQISYQIIGDTVTLIFPATAANSTSNANIVGNVGFLRPALTQPQWSIPVYNQTSILSAGYISIAKSDGGIFIAPYGTLNPSPGNYGFPGFSLTYQLQTGI